jgi:hypothetical protein
MLLPLPQHQSHHNKIIEKPQEKGSCYSRSFFLLTTHAEVLCCCEDTRIYLLTTSLAQQLAGNNSGYFNGKTPLSFAF